MSSPAPAENISLTERIGGLVFIGGLLMTILGPLILLSLALLVGRETTLTCTKQGNGLFDCESRYSLLGMELEKKTLSDIELLGGNVDGSGGGSSRSRTSGGSSRNVTGISMYCVDLVQAQTVIDDCITFEVPWEGQGMADFAEKVDAFVKEEEQQTLRVSYGEGLLLGLLAGGIVSGVAGYGVMRLGYSFIGRKEDAQPPEVTPAAGKINLNESDKPERRPKRRKRS